MQTKRLFYIPIVLIVLIVMNLLLLLPVLASDEHVCPDHEATIQSLRNCVVHAAEMGHIDNRGIKQSLLAKLDAAQAAVDRQQNAVAVAQLQAFIHEVEAQAGKHIEASHASHMIMHAQEVINALHSAL